MGHGRRARFIHYSINARNRIQIVACAYTRALYLPVPSHALIALRSALIYSIAKIIARSFLEQVSNCRYWKLCCAIRHQAREFGRISVLTLLWPRLRIIYYGLYTSLAVMAEFWATSIVLDLITGYFSSYIHNVDHRGAYRLGKGTEVPGELGAT